MGEMRDSDWSRENLLRSDWLPLIGATITTAVFFRHISEVKEKLSLTVIFEYNGRQNNNKEYRLLRNSLWTAVKSSMGGGRFGSRRLLDITLEKLRCSFSG